jgi:hypothetical protein
VLPAPASTHCSRAWASGPQADEGHGSCRRPMREAAGSSQRGDSARALRKTSAHAALRAGRATLAASRALRAGALRGMEVCGIDTGITPA